MNFTTKKIAHKDHEEKLCALCVRPLCTLWLKILSKDYPLYALFEQSHIEIHQVAEAKA